MALFNLEKYVDAKETLTLGLSGDTESTTQKQIKTWIRKCNSEIEGAKRLSDQISLSDCEIEYALCMFCLVLPLNIV